MMQCAFEIMFGKIVAHIIFTPNDFNPSMVEEFFRLPRKNSNPAFTGCRYSSESLTMYMFRARFVKLIFLLFLVKVAFYFVQNERKSPAGHHKTKMCRPSNV